MKRYLPNKKNVFSWKGAAVVVVLLAIFLTNMLYTTNQAEAALLSSASVQMSDPRPSATGVTYTVTFTFPGTTTIQCMQVLFGNSVANIGVTAPTSMTNGSGGSLSGGGLTNGSWTFYSGATAGTDMQFEDASGQASTATSITLTVTGVTNTSDSTLYSQVKTFSTVSTHTCSGAVDASNTMALVTQAGISATATVNPSLTVSIANDASAVNGSGTPGVTTTATTIPFATLTAGTPVVAAHTVQVSTNAAHGYFLYIRSSAAMTDSNSDTISDTSGTNASPAAFSGSSSTSAWGYTTDNSNETARFTNNTWAKFTTSNLEVAKATAAVNADTTHIGYQIEASNTTPPGSYSTTVTLTATPTY